MNELMSIIQIRYINVTRTTRHNLATKHNKEAKNGKK